MQTSALIPRCHQLNLSWIDIEFEIGEDRSGIAATAIIRESTAVSMATLTICDMGKEVNMTMEFSRPQPRMAIITVGDELRMPGAPIERFAIYASNLPLLEACVQASGGISTAREA